MSDIYDVIEIVKSLHTLVTNEPALSAFIPAADAILAVTSREGSVRDGCVPVAVFWSCSWKNTCLDFSPPVTVPTVPGFVMVMVWQVMVRL